MGQTKAGVGVPDSYKKDSLEPDEIEFELLTIEDGADNTVHEFKKSEDMEKSNYGPTGLKLYNQADNERRKMGRTGEEANVGPNKAVHAAGPTRNEQAKRQAALDKQKSKKNPVKVYNKRERKRLAQKMGLLAASEEMQKAPAEFPQPQIAQFSVKTPRWGKPAKTEKIKDGLYHHIYQPSAGSFVHILSPHVEPEEGQTHFAEMVGSAKKHPKTKEKLLRVHTAQVGPEHSGQGYGKLLYGLVARHHGGIVSDRIVSPQARKVYEHFQNHPDYHVEIGERVTREPTEDEIDEHGFDRANYGTPHYLRYRPAQQGKLAASEEAMAKSPGRIAAGLAIAAGLSGTPAQVDVSSRQQMKIPKQQVVAEKNPYTSQRMLGAIENVESRRGKYMDHKPTRSGESAYGKFALMPDIIRDTIRMHPDLKKQHAKATRLRGDDIHRYMQDNPSLEEVVAQRHLARLESHFGQDPEKLGYAWLNGVVGTHRALKQGKDLKNHWHVKKIKNAWEEGGSQKVATTTP